MHKIKQNKARLQTFFSGFFEAFYHRFSMKNVKNLDKI